METLLQNLRFSLRMLARNPGLTITVLLTLALGIGANTAIFTIDYATLLAPLPYPQPDQIVMVWPKIQNFHNRVAAGDFLDATLAGDSDNIAYVAWDNSNHLYATGSGNKLYVFTVTPTGYSQAPGSPYTLTDPQNIVVRSIAPQQ